LFCFLIKNIKNKKKITEIFRKKINMKILKKEDTKKNECRGEKIIEILN